ncbi:hypothetical protein [Streptomyces hirsutus]|uniref:hypothetical protein n=1 Tax=Streptomyces hirsutus TaxID=35620 RepID=UPI003320BCF8
MASHGGEGARDAESWGDSIMAAQAGVWSGIALDADPRMREFQADPAAYMEQRASTLRSGDLDKEEARLLKQKNQSFRAALSSVLHIFRKK